MKAVILAGGLGKRLQPFTEIIPKPLLPIGEKAILEIQIESLKKHGFDEIFLATNYKSEYIRTFFGNGERLGVKLTISKEEKPLGTCGPCKLLEGELTEPFFVMNGDILTAANFSAIYDFALKEDSMFTVVTKKMIFPFEFGNVWSDGNRVIKVQEKPDFEVEILAGIYVCKPEIMSYIPTNEYFGIDNLINKMLGDGAPISRYLLTEYWLDIGRIDSFEEAQEAYHEHFANKTSALILGGEGFIGSRLAIYLAKRGFSVCTLDKIESQHIFPSDIRRIIASVQDYPSLKELLSEAELIFDCMGMTAHHLGVEKPFLDLEANLSSHLHFIQNLRNLSPGKKVIYLGSTSQFGRPEQPEAVNEKTQQLPLDPQGINKSAAEHYFRIYSRLYNFHALTVRFPNCFGPHQKTEDADIGLIGGFIRGCLNDETIEIYGSDERFKNIIFVDTLCSQLTDLAMQPLDGFDEINLPGQRVSLRQLMDGIITICGKGRYRVKPFPTQTTAIDVGDYVINAKKAAACLPHASQENLIAALQASIEYFNKSPS